MLGKLFIRNESGENHGVLHAHLGDQFFDSGTVTALPTNKYRASGADRNISGNALIIRS